ncbi:unnamed protein product [Sphagnum balticum]
MASSVRTRQSSHHTFRPAQPESISRTCDGQFQLTPIGDDHLPILAERPIGAQQHEAGTNLRLLYTRNILHIM